MLAKCTGAALLSLPRFALSSSACDVTLPPPTPPSKIPESSLHRSLYVYLPTARQLRTLDSTQLQQLALDFHEERDDKKEDDDEVSTPCPASHATLRFR